MNDTRDTENMDNWSELSSLHPTNSIVIPSDGENLEEIFAHLYEEMKDVLKQITRLNRKAANTPRPSCITVNNEKTVVLRELETLLENKTRIVGELTKSISNSTDFESLRFRGDALLTIPTILEAEVTNCKELLERLVATNDNNQKYIELLSKWKRFLEEMNENLENSDHVTQNLHMITMKVNKEYKECRRDFNTVIETIFPDPQVREIMGDLIEKLMNNEDENDHWYEITDPNVFPIIAQLSNFNIITRNPQNVNQYKIVI